MALIEYIERYTKPLLPAERRDIVNAINEYVKEYYENELHNRKYGGNFPNKKEMDNFIFSKVNDLYGSDEHPLRRSYINGIVDCYRFIKDKIEKETNE